MPHIEAPRLAWSPREVAATAGLPYRTVLDEIREGRLKAVRVGKHYRVSDSELRRWIGELDGSAALTTPQAQAGPQVREHPRAYIAKERRTCACSSPRHGDHPDHGKPVA